MTVTRFEGTDPVSRYWLAHCEGFAVEGAARGVVEELQRDEDPHVTARLVVRTRGGRRKIVQATCDRERRAGGSRARGRAPAPAAAAAARRAHPRGRHCRDARCRRAGGSEAARGRAAARRCCAARRRRGARGARGARRRSRRALARRSSRPSSGRLSFAHGGHARVAALGGSSSPQRTRAGVGDGIAAILGLLANPDLISFAGGFPDPLTFPRERAAAAARGVRRGGRRVRLPVRADARARRARATRSPARLESLQGAPAGRRRAARSRAAAIEALELVGKSFLDRGDTVVVEAPTYLGAIMAFRGFEAEVVAVPLDEDGLDVDALDARARRRAAAEAALHDPRPPEPGRA